MYRALLIDLSGTLHIGSRAIPRAVESLARLRAAGVPFRICTNTSKVIDLKLYIQYLRALVLCSLCSVLLLVLTLNVFTDDVCSSAGCLP